MRIITFLIIMVGVIYPSAIYCIGISLFPHQAAGSLIKDNNNTIIGSQLIGQHFHQPRYFWPRPSFSNYNAMNSGGANLALSSSILQAQIIQRAAEYNDMHIIPVEMVTNSASGLDPHISYEMAWRQIPRVAQNRKLKHYQIANLIDSIVEKPILGMIGEHKINVLRLNIELDKRFRRN